MPAIEVTPAIVIDQSELAFSFARAGGSGGQRERTLKVAGASPFSGDRAWKRRDAAPPSQKTPKTLSRSFVNNTSPCYRESKQIE